MVGQSVEYGPTGEDKTLIRVIITYLLANVYGINLK